MLKSSCNFYFRRFLMNKSFKNNSSVSNLILNFNKGSIPQSVLICVNSEKKILDFSKYLAQYILCKNKNNLCPCLKCVSCVKIKEGNHPDVIYPERSGTQNTYSVDTVRKIKLDTSIMPNESKFKIYIFFDSELMGRFAQNALLKILEEPPGHVIFLFFCNNLNTILGTVKSRCQIFNVDLKETDKSNRKFLYKDLAKELLEILIFKTEYEALLWSNNLKTNKELLKDIISYLITILKSVVYVKFSVVDNELLDFDIYEKLLEKFSSKNLLHFIDVLNDVNFMLMRNVNFNLLITYFLSSLFNY